MDSNIQLSTPAEELAKYINMSVMSASRSESSCSNNTADELVKYNNISISRSESCSSTNIDPKAPSTLIPNNTETPAMHEAPAIHEAAAMVGAAALKEAPAMYGAPALHEAPASTSTLGSVESSSSPEKGSTLIPTCAEKPARNEAPDSKSTLGPVTGSSSPEKGKDVASAAPVPAVGGSTAEQARIVKEQKENAERLAWCERFDAAQSKGPMSVLSQDYLQIVGEWKSAQKEKVQGVKMEKVEAIANPGDYVKEGLEMKNGDFVHKKEREVKRKRRFILF